MQRVHTAFTHDERQPTSSKSKWFLRHGVRVIELRAHLLGALPTEPYSTSTTEGPNLFTRSDGLLVVSKLGNSPR
eukprot:5587222-Amphidinium_carterae.1